MLFTGCRCTHYLPSLSVVIYQNKMAGNLGSFCAVVLILVFCSVAVFGRQPRPLMNSSTSKLGSSLRAGISWEGVGDRLSLPMMKHSGPSKRDGGHKSRLARILVRIEDSGPSPGDGHKHHSRKHQ